MISIFDETGTVNAEGGPFAGPGPLRGAQGGQGAAEGAGPRARLEAARARGRPLPALRDGRRADAVDAVVREDGAAGQAGHRGGGAGQDQVRPRELVEDLLPLDAQHPRLVHLAAAVVGAPHPGLVLRQVQRDRRWRARRPPPAASAAAPTAQAGRGRARHLVLVVALAVRDAGLARRDARAQDLLPDDGARHRLRHPLLLGGAHDDGGPALHEEGALPHGLPAHDGDATRRARRCRR